MRSSGYRVLLYIGVSLLLLFTGVFFVWLKFDGQSQKPCTVVECFINPQSKFITDPPVCPKCPFDGVVLDPDLFEFLALVGEQAKNIQEGRRNQWSVDDLLNDPAVSDKCKKSIKESRSNKNFNSQYHQDWIMYHNMYRGKRDGFYVDVGAHKPDDLSNSWFFDVCLGWKGVCIEPFPGHHELWEKSDRSCTFVKKGVSDEKGVMDTRVAGCGFSLVGNVGDTVKIDVDTIDGILSELGVKKVDWASIDPDGVELKAVKGFDLRRWSVDYVVIEMQRKYMGAENFDKLVAEFLAKGYLHIASSVIDRIYMKGPMYHLDEIWIRDTVKYM